MKTRFFFPLLFLCIWPVSADDWSTCFSIGSVSNDITLTGESSHFGDLYSEPEGENIYDAYIPNTFYLIHKQKGWYFLYALDFLFDYSGHNTSDCYAWQIAVKAGVGVDFVFWDFLHLRGDLLLGAGINPLRISGIRNPANSALEGTEYLLPFVTADPRLQIGLELSDSLTVLFGARQRLYWFFGYDLPSMNSAAFFLEFDYSLLKQESVQ